MRSRRRWQSASRFAFASALGVSAMFGAAAIQSARSAQPAQYAKPAPAAMFGGDARHTGVSGAAPVQALAGVRFAFRTEGPVRATPAVVQGVVYVGSGDGRFYAIDAKTGALRWSFQSGGAINSSAAVVDSIVCFVSRDGFLYVLRTSDGEVQWKLRLGKDLGTQNYWDYYLSSPTIVAGRLYVGGGDGKLYAIDLKTHRTSWQFDAGARIRSTPAVSADLVVFGTMSGHVYAVARADGALRWRFASKGASQSFADFDNDTTSIVSSPSISAGVVTVGGRDGFLYGLDLATGKEKWRITHDGSSWIPSTAIDAGVVYVGSGSAQIVQAADLNTGAERWRFKTDGAVFSAVTLAGNLLLVSDFSGSVYALDRASGTLRWHFPLGARSLSTPVVADDAVYCGADDGFLYALEGATTTRNGATTTQAGVDGAPPTRARRLVYWEGRKSEQAFSWFANNVDLAVLNYFKSAGYEQLDAPQLAAFMREESTGHAHSVVVFADNRIPAALAEVPTEQALIRRYLDAGGKIVLLGANPLAYRSDPETGAVESIDFSVPGKVFGIRFPEPSDANGYYGTHVTSDGRRWGLRGFGTGSGALDPGQASETLMLDEFGMASSWVKNYGGPEGTGLVQLAISRTAPGDLASIRAATEFGLD